MKIIITELAKPLVIRRAVAFASAIYLGVIEVEGVRARKVDSLEEALAAHERGEISVLIDPQAQVVAQWEEDVVVDAIMAKRNTGTKITDAPLVIALGPGFEAGLDVHAVVETARGHNLGRVILAGRAEPDTGLPGEVAGYTVQRVVRAPSSGTFQAVRQIGDRVEAGAIVGYVGSQPVRGAIGGVLRGLIADGVEVVEGMKLGDVDPRGVVEYCFTISDKARSIGGGVVEAILYLGRIKGLL
jgi:xanthine dehydrogenase accessory factor